MTLKLNLGAHVKEMANSVNTKTGGWRTFMPVIDNEKCVDCGSCWTFCPDMSIVRKDDGVYEVNLDFCKGCGICSNECPVEAIKMVLEEK